MYRYLQYLCCIVFRDQIFACLKSIFEIYFSVQWVIAYKPHLYYFYILEPTKPLNVIAVNVSSTTLKVTWTEPERRNGILTGYTIYYRLIRNDRNENVTAAIVSQTISQTIFNLTGLGKNTICYCFFYTYLNWFTFLIRK